MNVETLIQRALQSAGAGDYHNALHCFARVLAVQPDHADVLNSYGGLLGMTGQGEQALACFDRVLILQPNRIDVLNNRALALGMLGRHEEAVGCCDRVLGAQPRNLDALCNRGYSLNQLGRHAEALVCLDLALAINPGHLGALDNRGLALGALARHGEALKCFERILSLRPDQAGAWISRGLALEALERHQEALDSFGKVLALRPDHLDALFHQGVALWKLMRPEAALRCFERILGLEPRHFRALANRAIALGHLDRAEEALECLEQALQVDPAHAESLCNRGMARLALGDLPGGFRDMEQRWRAADLQHARLETSAPLWLGETPLQGRTLLLHHEQGLGDTLQFVRYAPLLAARGACVIVRVPRVLQQLLHTLPGPLRIVAEGEALPPHDCHCPMMSLPLACGTTLETIPAPVPYLCAEPARAAAWSERLGASARPRIGLVWAGRQYGQINYVRDMPLHQLRPLLRLDADFISLQKDIPAADAVELRAWPRLGRHGEALGDFADTAALIANLDLVITVDTAVAHLAGALGKPVWILNRYAGCWRWLRGRTDSPWYPDARLFRQRSFGDWGSVIEQVRAALQERFPGLKPQTVGAAADATELAQPAPMDAASAQALVGEGIAALARGDCVAALDCLCQVTAAHPGNFDAQYNLGAAYGTLGRYEQALRCCDRALSLEPDHAGAMKNRGRALAALLRHEEALACFERVLQLEPGQADALYDRGCALGKLNRGEEARACLEQVLALQPAHAEAQFNLGLIELSCGELKQGFRRYESRWQTPYLRDGRLATTAPLWLGNAPLAGKTILLHNEQGYGDVLQFARYAPLVAARGGRVVLRVQSTLCNLMSSLDGVQQLVSSADPLPRHDFHCPLMSLPLAFGTTLESIPARTPYLKADPALVEAWRARLWPHRRPRIGLVWAGRQYGLINHARDMRLHMLLPLLRLDAEFVSLQKEVPQADRAELEAMQRIARHGEALGDFADTAALIANLDLLITVDTSVAHLAGALGQPVWIMNRYTSCWRWLQHRADSPWYPSARLFRQPTLGDWEGMVEQVCAAAGQLL